jgi:hypothetical protein
VSAWHEPRRSEYGRWFGVSALIAAFVYAVIVFGLLGTILWRLWTDLLARLPL